MSSQDMVPATPATPATGQDIKTTATPDADTRGTRPSSSVSSVTLFGVAVLAAAVFGFGGWAAMAPLASAVHAPAVLVVKGERKEVQHLEGGIVSEILVEEGDVVEAGAPLLLLSQAQAQATVSRLRNQIDQNLAQQARLTAELERGETIDFPDELLRRRGTETVGSVLETERQQFAARRASLEAQIAILEQRIGQFEQQILGLRVQRQSREDELAVLDDEIAGLRELYEKGHYPRSQVLAMERTMIRLQGGIGSDDAEIARARNGLGESRAQILSLRQQFQEDVIDQLRETRSSLTDLRERIAVAEDVLERIVISAPLSGIVQNLSVHTVGGVVRPADVLMEIVPQDTDLFIEANIQPADVDEVTVGQAVEIRLVSLDFRTTPSLTGTVTALSGDRLTDDASREEYFLARITIDPGETDKLDSARLTAGMPAEVLVSTGQRTLLEYLIKPLTDAFSRSLIES